MVKIFSLLIFQDYIVSFKESSHSLVLSVLFLYISRGEREAPSPRSLNSSWMDESFSNFGFTSVLN